MFDVNQRNSTAKLSPQLIYYDNNIICYLFSHILRNSYSHILLFARITKILNGKLHFLCSYSRVFINPFQINVPILYPRGFLMFPGGVEMRHRPEIGELWTCIIYLHGYHLPTSIDPPILNFPFICFSNASSWECVFPLNTDWISVCTALLITSLRAADMSEKEKTNKYSWKCVIQTKE